MKNLIAAALVSVAMPAAAQEAMVDTEALAAHGPSLLAPIEADWGCDKLLAGGALAAALLLGQVRGRRFCRRKRRSSKWPPCGRCTAKRCG